MAWGLKPLWYWVSLQKHHLQGLVNSIPIDVDFFSWSLSIWKVISLKESRYLSIILIKCMSLTSNSLIYIVDIYYECFYDITFICLRVFFCVMFYNIVYFCHTTTWISSCPLSLNISHTPYLIPFLYRFSKSTRLSFLCYTATSHWLCILYIVMYMFQGSSLNLPHSLPPLAVSIRLFFISAFLLLPCK